MPNESKPDPFKPQQPAIPGVPSIGLKNDPAAPRGGFVPRVAIATAVALAFGAGLFFHRSRTSPPELPSSDSQIVQAASPVRADPPNPNEGLILAPGPVATTQELARTWSSKRFLFRDPVSAEPQPAVVVRLPHGQYWGISLREPFGKCELEYVSDLEKLRTEYSFRADHPMVGNPCTHAVYDLLQYGGGAGNDELVRGVIVQGSGIRPPMAIEIRTEGNKVLAVREE